MEMSKETHMAKKGETALAPIDPALTGSWSKSYGVDPSDVLIPRVLLMQPISDLVTRGDRRPGDLVRSTTGELLAAAKAPVEIIPLFIQKVWVLLEKVDNKYEFRGTEPFTAQNAQNPWDFEAPSRRGKGTVPWRRDAANDLYALIPADIARFEQALAKQEKTGELPDPATALLPVVVRFSRTSFRTGKDVATHFAQADSFHQAPAATTLSLVSEFEEGDKGNYFVFKMGARRKTAQAELVAAKAWFHRVTNNAYKIDEEEVVDVAAKHVEGKF